MPQQEDETPTSDGAASTNDETASPPSGASEEIERLTFPPPKYVVTIVSPRVITLHESDASLDEWKEFEESDKGDDKATTLLNLHVLLVSLLNRLLRARLFPRRAVHSYITPAAGTDDHEWVVFSILTPATVLPILLSKCEHFGVGNLVGLVYAVPLETCVLPMLNETIEEEDDGLLTVPSQFDPAPISTVPASHHKSTSTASSNTNSSVGGTSLPDSSVLVMAPSHKKTKTPDPTIFRPVLSETFDQSEGELEEINVAAGTAGPNLQRSSSHPDVLQTSKTDDVKKEKASSEEKQRETPLLEMIPEAKKPANTSTSNVDNDTSGKSKDSNKSENVTATKSALIQKVLDARKEWLATASRIRVEQVAEEVSSAAALTWDYLLFVICAAAISATGLATDSSVTVLASMLVSPIMGPILAVTFGTMIRRPTMVQKALRNEAISLLLCVLVGAL